MVKHICQDSHCPCGESDTSRMEKRSVTALAEFLCDSKVEEVTGVYIFQIRKKNA
jgi:hypothetical protein